jgi:polar amino acid transport system substrate-binding protein
MQIERSAIPGGLRVRLVCHGAAIVLLGLVAAMPASAATLDRIRESGRVKLGYLADARPFSYRTDLGADGYSVALCNKVVEELKAQPGLADVTVDLVPLEGDDRLREVAQGGVDLLCTPISVTLDRRQQVSFSIPVYAGGIRAAVRADAPVALRQALGETPVGRPVWRGSPAATVLGKSSFGVVAGTTTERWLADRLKTFHIDAKSVSVPDHRTGVEQLLDRKIDVFFGDPSLILGAIEPASTDKVVILERMLTHEPLALALARNDDDFRLLVDRALSKAYSSEDFPTLYRKWFGDFSEGAQLFFLWNTPSQ